MSTLNESVREQLRKIAELAERGVGGEQANARELLAKLCKRYGVSAEGLLDEKTTSVVEFVFKGEDEKSILINVLLFACQRRNIRMGVLHRGKVSALLTKVEEIDAVACWAHYRAAWRDELALFKSAFVHKHHIFGPPSEIKEPTTPEDLQRVERLLKMMRGVGGATWQRPVALLEGNR